MQPPAAAARVLGVGVTKTLSSFGIYLVGFIILIIGLSYGAFLAGVAAQWILVGAISALGIGVLAGVSTMRRRDVG